MCIDIVGDDAPGCYCNRSVEFFYNHSEKHISDTWTSQNLLVISLSFTVCAFIFFGNTLVMVAIFVNRGFRYPIYYLLGNLAAADLFAGISYLYLMIYTGPWLIKMTKAQWFVRQGLVNISMTASVVNLLALAVERHQIIFNMQLHSKMSNCRVVLLILGIWLVSLPMGFIPSMGWNCLCDLEDCSTMMPLYRKSYLIFWAVLNLVTFIIMVIIYMRIFLYVQKKIQGISQHPTQKKQMETAMSLMKTLIIILGTFLICWTPALVMLLLDGLSSMTTGILKVHEYIMVLAACNSMVNPIIYSLRNQEMLSTFKVIFCCLCKRGWVQFNNSSLPDARETPQNEKDIGKEAPAP